MYAPHVVTLYNVTEDATTLELTNNITILDGVFLDIGKARNVEKTGLSDANAVTLFIPFSVTATDGLTGKKKTYIPPKEYKRLGDKSNHWTLEPGGESSGADCFFVKGKVISTESYRVLREQLDYVYDVSTVDLRDFGSTDMQHWQVGGR